MRVIEPKTFKNAQKNQKLVVRKLKTIRNLAIFLFCSLLITVLLLDIGKSKNRLNSKISQANTKDKTVTVATNTGQIGNFTGQQFKQLYQSIAYPNTQQLTVAPQITGNIQADQRIQQLAAKRGYRLTSIPVSPIQKFDESIEEDYLLQPLALKSWLEMQKAARADGQDLDIISAYRSIELQKQFFLSRLLSSSVTVESIAAGRSDQAIEATLSLTAVPGYSRHHTGYTIDLGCQDATINFESSSCFNWLNANNYANAKRFGWIPSYPKDAQEQGPEPESWEYVWVGIDSLKQAQP